LRTLRLRHCQGKCHPTWEKEPRNGRDSETEKKHGNERSVIRSALGTVHLPPWHRRVTGASTVEENYRDLSMASFFACIRPLEGKCSSASRPSSQDFDPSARVRTVQYAIINNRAPSRAQPRRPSNRKWARFHALLYLWRYSSIPALQVQSRRVASLHVLEEDLGGRGQRLSEGSSEFASESAKPAPVYSVAFPDRRAVVETLGPSSSFRLRQTRASLIRKGVYRKCAMCCPGMAAGKKYDATISQCADELQIQGSLMDN
jgi:hypothetical protein